MKSSNPIRVAIADERQMVRQMLVSTLAGDKELKIVAQAHSGEQALEACLQSVPDVLVLDYNVTGPSSIEVTRRLQQLGTGVRVLVLSSGEEESSLFDSIAAGAQGYLSRDASVDELIDAIKLLASNKAALQPSATLSLLREFQRTRTPLSPQLESANRILSSLTPRELEVLTLLGRGFSNKDIGTRLIISEKTAKTHVANLLRRLGVKDRVGAAIFAVKAGLSD